jgi:antitoxin ParD1/3/4
MQDGNHNPIILDAHFQQFIAHQIETGRYATATDAVHLGLRLLEDYETKRNALRQALSAGEDSGIVPYTLHDLLNDLDDPAS